MSGVAQPKEIGEDPVGDGEAFGRSTGRRIATEMTGAHRTRAELTAIGAEGVSEILARADALADAGLDQTAVTAWTEAAADAFRTELDRAAILVRASDASGQAH